MDVLERFANGDLDAFEELFRRFQGPVYGWIVRIVRDRGVAEDLTVETFWRIYRAHARFDPRREFGAWARTIAMHAAIDHLKHARPALALPAEVAAAPQPDAALQREVAEHVQQALRELPAGLEAVAILALLEDEPYEQIAAALGIAVGTVKSRVYRAVRLLRKKLKRRGIEP